MPRILTPIAISVALAACSSSPQQSAVDVVGQPDGSTQDYLEQAKHAQGSAQQDLLILALKAELKNRNAANANDLISKLSSQELTEIQRAEVELARVQVLILEGRTEEASLLLAWHPERAINNEQWYKYHDLRAYLFSIQGLYLEAAEELSFAYPYAQEELKATLSEDVWLNFTQADNDQIEAFNQLNNEDVVDKWLELALIYRGLENDLPKVQEDIQKWLIENPNHQAAIHPPKTITNFLALDIANPRNTALLLPLSGKYAAQGQLVRDGFLYAMSNDLSRDPKATITIIDTQNNSVDEIEETLQSEHIDFIVGPLLKNQVNKQDKQQNQREGKIQTLALNTTKSTNQNTNFCYLALSPEQEVEQAAQYMFEQGYKYPLIIAPQSRLGSRVVTAFEEKWSELSEHAVTIERFKSRSGLQQQIQHVFGLNDSQDRITQLEQVLDSSYKTQQRSRRDIDAVYIAAKYDELTLIKPFIEVAINPEAKSPTLFANSISNPGNQKTHELRNVKYSDIPLLTKSDSPTFNDISAIWPKYGNNQKRLQALGMDAYALTTKLSLMTELPNYKVDGHLGLLSIDETCTLQRSISWSEYGK
ncbi:penicillin-binding protein activator [Vibrio sp.]|nr:penicillin-binding protein activator [Vibrio sp.]